MPSGIGPHQSGRLLDRAEQQGRLIKLPRQGQCLCSLNSQHEQAFLRWPIAGGPFSQGRQAGPAPLLDHSCQAGHANRILSFGQLDRLWIAGGDERPLLALGKSQQEIERCGNVAAAQSKALVRRRKHPVGGALIGLFENGIEHWFRLA